jgi:hypothetical protein
MAFTLTRSVRNKSGRMEESGHYLHQLTVKDKETTTNLLKITTALFEIPTLCSPIKRQMSHG